MGASDAIVIEDQKKYLIITSSKFFDRNKIKKIAHLGLPKANSLVGGKEWNRDTSPIWTSDAKGNHRYVGRACDLALKIDPDLDEKDNPNKVVPVKALPRISEIFPNAKNHYYDILNNNFDITKDWEIRGYDMVICYRTSMHVKDKDHFFEQLKLCIKNNKNVVFDFLERSIGWSGLSISINELKEAGIEPRNIWSTYNPHKKHLHNYMYFNEE